MSKQPSRVVQENIDALIERERVGRIEHGDDMDRTDFPVEAWLAELISESLDSANYGRKLQHMLPKLVAAAKRLEGMGFAWADGSWQAPKHCLSADEVNALPERVRKYIMWLETNADPGHTMQDNFRLAEENAALRAMLAEQPAAAQEAVVTYCGRRLTPEGTRECWGVLSEGVADLPRGTKLYVAAAPFDGCPYCGGTAGHWEGCRAPVDTHTPVAPTDVRSLALAVEQALGWRDGERDAELDSLLETAMGILAGTPAAPVRVTVRVDGVGTATLEVVNGGVDLPLDTVVSMARSAGTSAPADTWFADQLTAMGEVIPLDSNPAAPGIDLEPFREAVAYWRDTALRDMQYQNGPLHEQANEAQRLLDLIDASRKGGDAQDAARYRWLRKHFRFANDSLRELWFDPAIDPNDGGVPEDLDQEIDRTMSNAHSAEVGS